jgi:hypothetical protein
VIRAVLALVLLLAATVGAEALDVGLDGYREARRTGAIGVVAGRVAAEPRTARGPAVPLTGATVMLLPRSESVLLRLEQLKARSRDSASAFAAAAPGMRQAQEGYEGELWKAGAADLATKVLVDADGKFRLGDVPAGAWLVLGWHGVSVDVAGERVRTKERSTYRPQNRLRAYQAVTVWLRTLTVSAGETATLELTDRNAWFRGVIEERELDAGR